jgi:hypothetical protein
VLLLCCSGVATQSSAITAPESQLGSCHLLTCTTCCRNTLHWFAEMQGMATAYDCMLQHAVHVLCVLECRQHHHRQQHIIVP